MKFGVIGTRCTYRSNMARYTRNPLVVEFLKRDSKPAYRVCQRVVYERRQREGKKTGKKMREQQREKKIVKGEKKQRDEEKSGSSTCRSAYAYAVSRVSNPGEGLALLLVVEAVEPGVVTNVFVNFQWMERKKKNRSKVLIATVDWPTYVRKDLSRFELIRVVFFIRFYDNFQRPPFSIRSMDSDTDNSTSNYYSRAMKKKMQSRAGFYVNWTIGRYDS